MESVKRFNKSQKNEMKQKNQGKIDRHIHQYHKFYSFAKRLFTNKDNHQKDFDWFVNKLKENFPFLSKNYAQELIIKISNNSFYTVLNNGNIVFQKYANHSRNENMYFDFFKYNKINLRYLPFEKYNNYNMRKLDNCYSMADMQNHLIDRNVDLVVFTDNKDKITFLSNEAIDLDKLSDKEINFLFSKNPNCFIVTAKSLINNINRLPEFYCQWWYFDDIKMKAMIEISK